MTEERDTPVRIEHLIAYAAGDLPPAERVDVESWLARHPDAQAKVARYRAARDALRTDEGVDPPPEVVARARSIAARATRQETPSLADTVVLVIARLLFDSRTQPAVAGLRGDTTGFQLGYSLSGVPGVDAELDLQFEPASGSGDDERWRIMGHVASPTSLGEFEVRVCRSGTSAALQTARSDARGGFDARVEPGRYDLHLTLEGGIIVVPDVRVE